jgi:hypothetical protein
VDSARALIRPGQLRVWVDYPEIGETFIVLEQDVIHLPRPRDDEAGWWILRGDGRRSLMFADDLITDSELVQEADDG